MDPKNLKHPGKLFSFLLTGIFMIISVSCTNEPCRVQEAKAVFEQGRQFEAENDIQNALIHYWNALDLFDTQKDTLQKVAVFEHLGDLLFRYGLYEKAVLHHREGYTLLQKVNDTERLSVLTRKLSLDYALLNQQDTSRYFLDLTNQLTLQNTDFQAVLFEMEQIHLLKNQALSDSICTVYQKEQLINLESKYHAEKERYLQEKARTERLFYISLFLCVVIILLILLGIIYYLKKKEERKRNEQFAWFNRIVKENKEKLDQSHQELICSSSQIEELREKLRQIQLSVQSTSLLKKELDYYILQQNEIREKEEQLKMRNEQLLSSASTQAVLLINQMKYKPAYNPIKTKQEWSILIHFMDLLFDDYSSKINALEGLTDRDREICYLLKLGFTTGQLAIFYGISPGSVTKAKFRLKKKIEADNPYMTTDFLCA